MRESELIVKIIEVLQDHDGWYSAFTVDRDYFNIDNRSYAKPDFCIKKTNRYCNGNRDDAFFLDIIVTKNFYPGYSDAIYEDLHIKVNEDLLNDSVVKNISKILEWCNIELIDGFFEINDKQWSIEMKRWTDWINRVEDD